LGVETETLPSSTFVNNPEPIYGGRAIGEDALMLRRLAGRNLWRHVDTLILQDPVDPYFQDYVAENGRSPEIIVPEGINPQAISIMDGINDTSFQKAIGKNRVVESYFVEPCLAQAVKEAGGTYFVDQPPEATDIANDKIRYASIVKGIVDVPEGVAVKGIRATVDAVMTRLAQSQGNAFVRHGASGGGLGNRIFSLDASDNFDETYVRKIIEANCPEMWADSWALVEKHLDLAWSPAVSFNQRRFTSNNLQINQKSRYVGSLSPVPPEIMLPEELEAIGSGTAEALHQLTGYSGPGNNDLGITVQGHRVGFEINARGTGITHAIEVGKLFFAASWKDWYAANHVIKTLDHFELKAPADFLSLYKVLSEAGLLASREDPYGTVITIPPVGSVVGIQVQGRGYKHVWDLYRRVDSLVGDPRGNRHDNPFIPT
jgi:hypothetical protein